MKEGAKVKNEAEAVEKLCYEHLSKHYSKLNQNNYRKNYLWNEDVDNILKAFKPLFLHLYQVYGGNHCKPGQEHFMRVDEFLKLVQDSGMINETLNQRDISLMFN